MKNLSPVYDTFFNPMAAIWPMLLLFVVILIVIRLAKLIINKEKFSFHKDFFALLFIIIVSIAITSKEFQNDTFYIIKVGESIFKNGIDMIDHFSIHNISYPYEHWLHDILVYGIYSKTGFFGLYI